ncbi:MAG: hypothetical protein ABSD74_06275 [Rhizomicrobium sp.]|jgi:hypothetical protein
MSNYAEIEKTIARTYCDCSEALRVYVPESRRKLRELLTQLETPLEKLDADITRERHGLNPHPDGYATEWRHHLHHYDIKCRAIADCLKHVKRFRVVAIKLKAQHELDEDLLKNLERVGLQIRETAVEAEKRLRHHHGWDPGHIELEEFRRSIEHRTDPKSDHIIARQFGLGGTQSAPMGDML